MEEKEKKKISVKKVFEIIGIVLLALFAAYLLPSILIILFFMSGFNDKYDITTDLAKYNEVIVGEKWGMSEEIFPENLEGLNVIDFKHVYYNPWDANYLGYLVVDYDDAAYEKELERLSKIGIEDYIGIYSVTGFSKHELLAMNSDDYQGFIYAMKGEGNEIIYVEIVFCNYFMDIKYENEIPVDYLPDGFNAKDDNPYKKEKLK